MCLGVRDFPITCDIKGIGRILDAPWMFAVFALLVRNAEETEYTRRAVMILAASYW